MARRGCNGEFISALPRSNRTSPIDKYAINYSNTETTAYRLRVCSALVESLFNLSSRKLAVNRLCPSLRFSRCTVLPRRPMRAHSEPTREKNVLRNPIGVCQPLAMKSKPEHKNNDPLVCARLFARGFLCECKHCVFPTVIGTFVIYAFRTLSGLDD